MTRIRWVWFLGAVAAVDLAARFACNFDFARSMHLEAFLFPVAAVAAFVVSKRNAPGPTQARTAQVPIVLLFAIGSVRPILWSLGVPLELANLVTLMS